MPRMGSLFSGVGGFELGFERAGWNCAWQVEIDNDATKVLTHHWPDVARHRDVREVGAHNLAPVDCITFGSPCQDLSVAGQRKGFDGERSGLFFEAIRVIAELRPACAIWENVPGALSSTGGRDFGAALDAMAECGAVEIGWRICDAQFWGVAQKRRRVFVVASFRSGLSAHAVLFEPEGGSRHPAPSREAGAGVAASLTAGVSRSRGVNPPGRRQEDDVNLVIAPALRSNPYGDHIGDESRLILEPAAYQCHGSNVGPMGTLRAGNGNETGGVPFVAHTLTANYGKQVDSSDRNGGPPNLILLNDHGGDRMDIDESGTVPTLRAENHRHAPMVAHTLRAEGHDASEDGTGRGVPLTVASMGVRRLTPLEAERLQGFPDGWTDCGLSDSARYRCLGNAVAVPVVTWIARRLRQGEETQ